MAVREWDVWRVGALVAALALFGFALRFGGGRTAAAAEDAASEIPIYRGGLADGWQDWSWASHELKSSQVTFGGGPSLKMDPSAFNGVYLHGGGVDTSGVRELRFQINGGRTGGQKLVVCVADAAAKMGVKVPVASFVSGGTIPAGRWAAATVPLSKLGADNTTITGVVFQDASGGDQANLYLADITLGGKAVHTAVPYTIAVDTLLDRRTISPLIYGMAGAGEDYLRDLRLGSNRWGGNPNSRYNWERGNCWNAARDWEFRNTNFQATDSSARKPSGAADDFVAADRGAGAATILTIPTIGWVAKDDNPESRSVSVPASGGPPISPDSDAISGYDPTENRQRTSVRSFPRKGRPFQDPPDMADGAVYQDEWVHHLVTKFGMAREGGIRFYAMDNEPDLWHSTHTDVHPVAIGYDDLLANFLEYATAVKAVDPTCEVTGPVSWGWSGYVHSPRDCSIRDFSGRPDRRAHRDMELIPWFLDQVHKHDQHTGRRTLDVLDIHYYPQGQNVYGGGTDAETNALRIRSTRGLYDPNYVDESWIKEPVMLVPRMKQWIRQYYPGTKLGITEWNWGAEGSLNGGIAAAEVLGIFGREGVDLANYWRMPPKGSPAYFAFKMYRNADDNGTGLGDTEVRAVSSVPNEVSCFGSVDSRSGKPIVMVINKQPARDAAVTVTVEHGAPLSTVSAWRYGGRATGAIARLRDQPAPAGVVKMTFPAYSITLLRFR